MQKIRRGFESMKNKLFRQGLKNKTFNYALKYDFCKACLNIHEVNTKCR